MTDWENKTNLTQPNRKTRQPWGQTDRTRRHNQGKQKEKRDYKETEDIQYNLKPKTKSESK